jgi:hypothetical protein
MPQKRKRTTKDLSTKDRWPSDYGVRQREEKSKGDPVPRKPSKKVSNIEEQGERANVRQNTPAKGLRNKR